MNVDTRVHFISATEIIAVPTGIEVFSWLTTLFRSELSYKATCLWSMVFVFVLIKVNYSTIELAYPVKRHKDIINLHAIWELFSTGNFRKKMLMALPLSNYLHGFFYSRYSDIVALTGSYPHIQSQISTQQHTYTYLDTLCSSILVCKLIQRIEFFFLPKDLYHRVKTDYPIGFKYSTSLEEEL